MQLLFGGHNRTPLVENGLTDLPKSGGCQRTTPLNVMQKQTYIICVGNLHLRILRGHPNYSQLYFLNQNQKRFPCIICNICFLSSRKFFFTVAASKWLLGLFEVKICHRKFFKKHYVVMCSVVQQKISTQNMVKKYNTN